jgi:hypothetical protein
MAFDGQSDIINLTSTLSCMNVDVAAILYTVINEIGKDKIRAELTQDISLSQKYCTEILSRSRARVGNGVNDEVLASFCEALLHFMLTVCMLPSQRKVQVRGVELDLVIPSVRALTQQPENAIVIQVYKSENDRDKLVKTVQLQPNTKNLWVVSAAKLSTDYRNYNLEEGNSFSSIVVDIYRFVKNKGISGLKLFHGD